MLKPIGIYGQLPVHYLLPYILTKALVQILQKIATKHQWDNHPVDLSDQTLLIHILAFANCGLTSQELKRVAIFEQWLLRILFTLRCRLAYLVVIRCHVLGYGDAFNCGG